MWYGQMAQPQLENSRRYVATHWDVAPKAELGKLGTSFGTFVRSNRSERGWESKSTKKAGNQCWDWYTSRKRQGSDSIGLKSKQPSFETPLRKQHEVRSSIGLTGTHVQWKINFLSNESTRIQTYGSLSHLRYENDDEIDVVVNPDGASRSSFPVAARIFSFRQGHVSTRDNVCPIRIHCQFGRSRKRGKDGCFSSVVAGDNGGRIAVPKNTNETKAKAMRR